MRGSEFGDYKKKLLDTYEKDLETWKGTSESERGEKPVKSRATVKATECTREKADEFAAQLTEKIEKKRKKAEAKKDKEGGS